MWNVSRGAVVRAPRSIVSELVVLSAALFVAGGWGASIGRGLAPLALAFAIAFALVLEAYATAVAVHLVPSLEGRRSIAERLGLDRSRLPLWLVGYLILGRPVLVLGLVAVGTVGSALWTAIALGIAVRRSDEPRAVVAMPGLSGSARRARLGEGLLAARDTAFWGCVFGRPLAALLLQGLAEARWLTPNRITVASSVIFVAAAGCAAAPHPGLSIVAALLLLVRSVLDSMDGQLARYRRASSRLGGYLDKVTDGLGWALLYLAVAWRAHRELGDPIAFLVPLVAAVTLYLLNLGYWLRTARAPAPAAPPVPAGDPLRPAAILRHAWRVVLLQEPDFYPTIGVALVLGRFGWLLTLLVVASLGRLVFLAAKGGPS